ncbi:peptidoglycan DD-metalloendopeptidase family protein [Streptomyces rishiriensis]|uniref:peptidoglycan DD-metalloendopeptidase family protein n=1 Tax=Streptomyces rishiriensis TaxID=68264 RepID=UPI0037A23C64
MPARRKAVLLALVAVPLALVVGGVMVLVLLMSAFTTSAEVKRQQDAALSFGSLCAAPMISADGKYANPLVGRPTSPFGPRPNPFGPGVLPPGFTSEEQLTFHYGADIGGIPTGTPFYAAASGVVEGAEIGGNAGGNVIRIRDADGNLWVYVHAADGTTVVKAGQRVSAGDHLAGAGATGAATGVHLHLELRAGPEGKSIDPVKFLADRGVTFGQGGPTPVGGAQKVGASTPTATPASHPEPPLQPGPTLRVPLPSGTTLPLAPAQQRNAAIIIGVGREMEVSDQAIIIALMTAFQESSLFNLASPAVPESLDYPHDRLGLNKASVGLFQQQHTMGWGTVQDLMNPEISTRTFFEGRDNPGASPARGLFDYPGWETLAPGVAAQTVQKSGHPDEYHKWENTAKFLLQNIAGADVMQCQSGPTRAGEAQSPEPGELQDEQARSGEGTRTVTIPAGVTRQDVVDAARSGIGGAYEWGSADFKSWDASGLVTWVYRDQGVQVPRTSAWTVGKRTESPQPGDLVTQRWDPDRNRWEHVGIYVGDGRMVAAVNETTGTREYPVAQTGDPVYFDILGGQR